MVHSLFEVRAGAFIFNNKKELLLMQNTNGTWGIVGGHLEKNESIEEALHREVKEETGMEIEIISQLGTKNDGESLLLLLLQNTKKAM
ncbi:MAG: NUDIX hydrolase [archaeon]